MYWKESSCNPEYSGSIKWSRGIFGLSQVQLKEMPLDCIFSSLAVNPCLPYGNLKILLKFLHKCVDQLNVFIHLWAGVEICSQTSYHLLFHGLFFPHSYFPKITYDEKKPLWHFRGVIPLLVSSPCWLAHFSVWGLVMVSAVVIRYFLVKNLISESLALISGQNVHILLKNYA